MVSNQAPWFSGKFYDKMENEAPILEPKPIKPRLKKKYKTKKEKGKDAKEAEFQELSTIGKAMMGRKVSLGEENNLRKIMYNVIEKPPCKSKEKDREGVGSSIVSLVKKTPSTPKKNKGKENVLDQMEEVKDHVDFHSSNEESNEEIGSLIIPFGGKGWQEGHETQ